MTSYTILSKRKLIFQVMNSTFDIIVIGAGPAGNSAAFHLAKTGYNVAVIDKRYDIGNKLCTGIIGTSCAELFPPDPLHIYNKAQSVTIVTPTGNYHTITKSKPQGYIIDRVSYISSLGTQAQNKGAHFILGATVTNISTKSTLATVELKRGSETHTLNCKVIIIATGFSSNIPMMAGLPNFNTREYMVGVQANAHLCEPTDTKVYLGSKVSPGSFGWLVPLDNLNCLVGMVSRNKLNGHMKTFLCNLKESGKIDSSDVTVKKWGIPIKPLRKTYTNRILVIGDAAGFAKPTTGGGIYYSILSGKIAADSVNIAFASNTFDESSMRNYEVTWKNKLGKELKVGYYARSLFEKLNDAQIDQLVNNIASEDSPANKILLNNFSFDWHSNVIHQALNQFDILNLFKSFGSNLRPILKQFQLQQTNGTE